MRHWCQALDALSKRDRRGVSGNYGLLDVIEALRCGVCLTRTGAHNPARFRRRWRAQKPAAVRVPSLRVALASSVTVRSGTHGY
jgi:hypothetical protein